MIKKILIALAVIIFITSEFVRIQQLYELKKQNVMLKEILLDMMKLKELKKKYENL